MEAGLPYHGVWSMTPREIQLVVDGYRKRSEREQELMAWHAANIMNCWVKKKVTPQKLLGRAKQSFERTLEGQKAFESYAKKGKPHGT